MAGHPTVGAFVLEREGLIPRVEKTNALPLEERIGVIRVSIRQEADAPAFIEMTQPLPKFGPVIQNRDRIAEMLSLDPKEVHDTGLPIQTVSCGCRFCSCLFATSPPREKYACAGPVRTTSRAVSSGERVAFTREVESAGAHIHSRMFAPALGIAEDPATGGASGPLGCYLVRHRVLPSDTELRCVSEQGIEMGRPSLIHIRIGHSCGEMTGVAVGGTCHYMGAGSLDL
jgi:trans-2,3-dihydro-3-hydroxyanthranilate isomerase